VPPANGEAPITGRFGVMTAELSVRIIAAVHEAKRLPGAGGACSARTGDSAPSVAGREEAGQLRDRLGGRLEVAADVLRLLVPGLGHQHQQGGTLLAAAQQAIVTDWTTALATLHLG